MHDFFTDLGRLAFFCCWGISFVLGVALVIEGNSRLFRGEMLANV